MAHDALFRQEALDAQATQWLGAIRLAQPISHRIAAAMALVVIGVIGTFAIFGTYTRRATAPGLLEPAGGSLRLIAPTSGSIVETRVVEGKTVGAGDVLFVLSGERVSSSGATQASIGAQLDARRASLERDLALAVARHESRARTVAERLVAIDVELAQLDREVQINIARERIADRNVERYDALAATGFIAPVQAQAKLDESLVLKAQHETYKRLAAGLARERAAISSQRAESRLQAEAERLDIERQLAAVEQERSENDARRSMLVTAPHAAVVTGIAAHAGQMVAAGALLATLIPEHAPLEAQLFASTRQSGFVEAGQRVRLRYAAYPFQKFGMGEGVVRSIEKSPYAPQELPSQVVSTLGPAALQGAEPVYRIVVALDSQTIATYGRPQPLRAGMVFEADVIQDRRRLYEWLFEPIYGLVGR